MLSHSEEITQLLIDHGADINAQNQHNITALRTAVTYNKPLIVQALINAGSLDTSIKDYANKTALDYAANNNEIKTMLEEYIELCDNVFLLK